jgi:SAM-dependent methyltransferase
MTTVLSHGLELETIACPFCGDAGRPAIEEGGWTGRACPTCRLIFVSPRPTAESIRRIYAGDEAHERASPHVSAFNSPIARLKARRVVRILESWSARGRLLELGPGGGAVLHAARRRGWEVGAVELNPEQASFIRDRLGIPCWPSVQAVEGTWDVVYHNDVLSHFPDAVETFEAVRKILRPGGLHVFESGSGDFDRRFDALFPSFQFPDHLFFYSETSLPMLLERSGFQLLRVTGYSLVPALRLERAVRWLRGGSVGSAGGGAVEDGQTSRGGPRSWARTVLAAARFTALFCLGRVMPRRRRPQHLLVVSRRA